MGLFQFAGKGNRAVIVQGVHYGNGMTRLANVCHENIPLRINRTAMVNNCFNEINKSDAAFFTSGEHYHRGPPLCFNRTEVTIAINQPTVEMAL